MAAKALQKARRRRRIYEKRHNIIKNNVPKEKRLDARIAWKNEKG